MSLQDITKVSKLCLTLSSHLIWWCWDSSSTPPGTKLILRSKVNVAGGFLLLTPSTVTILGGQVEHMIKKWNLEKVKFFVHGKM